MKPELYRTRAENCSCGMAVCRCPVDYVVYYAQCGTQEWVVERTSDKKEMARGSLEGMMTLIDEPNAKFKNGRRAHWAKDVMRFRPISLHGDLKL